MNKRTFNGGYKFENFGGQPEHKLINLGVPDSVLIPLAQGFGASLTPSVEEGEKVTCGQIIARDDEKVSSPIHSSVSGVVTDVSKLNHSNGDIYQVDIKKEGDQAVEKLPGFTPHWQKLKPQELERLIYLSGVSSLDRDGIPTSFKSSIINPGEVEDVIIQGVQSEVYNMSLDVLLGDQQLNYLIEGIEILKKIFPESRFHIAVNSEKKGLIQKLERFTAGLTSVETYPLIPKYPQEYDQLLIPTMLGKRFPYGYQAANIGVIVLSIQTVLQAREAVVEGKPLIERIVALCGPGFKENPHLKVRVGTTYDRLLEGRTKNGQARVILNSPLTGSKLQDLSLPIDRTCMRIVALPEDRTRYFLAFSRPGIKKDAYSHTFLSSLLGTEKSADTNLKGEQRPCVSCGFCQEVCPVEIIPHLLYKYVEREIIDDPLMDFQIYKCIECNLCSYVCPSKIPLAKYIVEGKEEMREEGFDLTSPVLSNFDLKGLDKEDKEDE